MVRFAVCTSRDVSEVGCSTSYASPCCFDASSVRKSSDSLVFELALASANAPSIKLKQRQSGLALFASIGLNLPNPSSNQQEKRSNSAVHKLVVLPC